MVRRVSASLISAGVFVVTGTLVFAAWVLWGAS